MHIRVINPNTTRAMTDLVGRSARVVAAPGVLVDAVQPTMGPASIESHYEEALSVPGILEQVALGEQEGVDGYVVACFGDPGLDAARELAAGPVVGIAEAAMHAATLVARRFAVVTTLDRTRGRAHELVARYGFAQACVAVRACEVAVLDLDRDPEAVTRIVGECRQAVEEDGAEAVVLGCAGMTSLCEVVAQQVGVPVLDGVAAATLLVQSLVTMGVRAGTHGEYAAPPAKPMAGLLAGFEIISGSKHDGRTGVVRSGA